MAVVAKQTIIAVSGESVFIAGHGRRQKNFQGGSRTRLEFQGGSKPQNCGLSMVKIRKFAKSGGVK